MLGKSVASRHAREQFRFLVEEAMRHAPALRGASLYWSDVASMPRKMHPFAIERTFCNEEMPWPKCPCIIVWASKKGTWHAVGAYETPCMAPLGDGGDLVFWEKVLLVAFDGVTCKFRNLPLVRCSGSSLSVDLPSDASGAKRKRIKENDERLRQKEYVWSSQSLTAPIPKEGAAVLVALTISSAATYLAGLLPLVVPCGYRVKWSAGRGYGASASDRRKHSGEVICGSVSYDRIYHEVLYPSGTHCPPRPHERDGHFRYHWKRDIGVYRRDLPINVQERVAIAERHRMIPSWVPPCDVGIRRWGDDNDAFEIQENDDHADPSPTP